MPNIIGGAGLTLPVPQTLYPSVLNNTPFTAPTNEITLQSGQSVVVPPGSFTIDLGRYCILQYQDPVNQPSITQNVGTWRTVRVARGTFQLRSDGVNFRVINPLGVPVAAVVTKGGTTYTQAGTTVASSSGGSTWQAIVGGRVGPVTLSNKGAGYGLPPVVNIAAPAGPGVAATAIANLSTNLTVKTITMINEGAGYATAPAITLTPSPFDTNVTTGSITTAVAAAALTGAGAVSAVLCTNNGKTLGSTVPTLTITGGDGSATATALLCTTLTAMTVATVGSGSITGAVISTAGGTPAATAAFLNPAVELTDFIPRAAQINISVTSAGALQAGTGVVVDGGMFLGTVLPIINTYGGLWNVTAATVTLTQGATSDTIIIQPN